MGSLLSCGAEVEDRNLRAPAWLPYRDSRISCRLPDRGRWRLCPTGWTAARSTRRVAEPVSRRRDIPHPWRGAPHRRLTDVVGRLTDVVGARLDAPESPTPPLTAKTAAGRQGHEGSLYRFVHL